MLGFLRARATPGVEAVDGSAYARTISVNGQHGSIRVAHAPAREALDLEVWFPETAAIPAITRQVKRMFDLCADPVRIGRCLRADPLLRGPLAKHPGIRLPGAWDGFELAVRAIVGQQISVRGATTLAGRIATMWGAPVDLLGGSLTRLFPTPEALVDAPIERAGIIASRAQAIRSLARGVLNGTLAFGPGTDAAVAVDALTAISGIGDWTAQYVAMRAFGEPDAFLKGDLVLRRMAGGLTPAMLERRSAAWRPWRAYAVMLLWQAAVDGAR